MRIWTCLTFAALIGFGAAAFSGEPPQEEPARSSGKERQAGTGNAGSLHGSILLGPKLSARKMRFHLYSDALAVAARPRPPLADEMRNVVVYLESATAAGIAQPSSGPVVMRQEGVTFEPHVLAVRKGTTVQFPNSDPIFHNVFSLSRASSFDLGRYPQGTSKSVTFDTAGIVKVFCHIHSDMSAVIVVLDNGHFVHPDASGRFRLDGIPPGEYRAVGWHERARPVRRPVRIEPGQATRLDLTIPLGEAEVGD